MPDDFQVNAGDYILVWADADEDGFFDGELLDGRRGLVPSNFVERLEHDDLVDSMTMAIMRFRQGGFITLRGEEDDDEPLPAKIRDYY